MASSFLERIAQSAGGISVEAASYHGWRDCIRIGNGLVEAILVPAIGRVMQFRFQGSAEGAFWENRALDGKLHDPTAKEWMNFGGDKSWPAPQSSWPLHQGRAWPPPVAFDALPMRAEANAGGVTMISEADPSYGIQVLRRVELDPQHPVLRIRTEFRKVAGAPVRVSVWTITQMQEPQRVALLLPEQSAFGEGFTRLLDAEPKDLRLSGQLLSLARHPADYVKIGAETAAMVWVGQEAVLRIDAEQGPGVYPDGGCVTEIYTNPDPLPYVELETLGPLVELSAGQSAARTVLYTLLPRTASGPDAEARRVL
jgi:hypothetical protein